MSKAKKSEFLKGFGKMFEIVKMLVNAVLDIGGDDSDMERILKDETLRKEIAKLIVGAKAVAKFVVADMFDVRNAAVNISYIGDNLKSWFYGKTEETRDVVIPRRHHDLKRDSLDAEILADLGGEAAAEVTLAGVYELMKLQGAGQSEDLLTNGYANIFYVRDKGGILRAVCVLWHGRGWSVSAFSVEFPYRWRAGYRAFSRNS